MPSELLILAASGSWMTTLSRYLSRPGTSRENVLFVLFALVIAGIWVVLFLWDRMRKQHAGPQVPKTLFEEFCQAHRLSQQEVALLVDAAQECRLPSPNHLFVQPQHLEMLSLDSRPRADVYRSLRERLFGEL